MTHTPQEVEKMAGTKALNIVLKNDTDCTLEDLINRLTTQRLDTLTLDDLCEYIKDNGTDELDYRLQYYCDTIFEAFTDIMKEDYNAEFKAMSLELVYACIYYTMRADVSNLDEVAEAAHSGEISLGDIFEALDYSTPNEDTDPATAELLEFIDLALSYSYTYLPEPADNIRRAYRSGYVTHDEARAQLLEYYEEEETRAELVFDFFVNSNY